MKIVWVCLVAAILVGCSPKKETSVASTKPTVLAVEVGTVKTDYDGKKYKLVQAAKDLGNGIYQSDLWERIDPLETNHWYTPTLGSVMDTNSPLIFNSLMR